MSWIGDPAVKFGVVIPTYSIKEDVFVKLKVLGFEGVEVFMNDLTSKERATLAGRLRSLTRDHGLVVSDIEGGANLLNLGLHREAERAVALCKETMEIAHRLGTPIVLLPAYMAPTQAKKEEVLARAGLSFRKLDKAAENMGIYLAIEPLNCCETNLLTTMAETVSYIDSIRTENVRMIADVFHLNIGEASIPEALRLASKYLVHMHISENHGGLPGTGSIDFGAIFRTLRAVRYKGFMSIEFHKRIDNWLKACERVAPYLQVLRSLNYTNSANAKTSCYNKTQRSDIGRF